MIYILFTLSALLQQRIVDFLLFLSCMYLVPLAASSRDLWLSGIFPCLLPLRAAGF